MVFQRFLGVVILGICLCFSSCKKDKDDPDDMTMSPVDPLSLAEGTITFDLDGVNVTTTEGAGGRVDAFTYSLGNLAWTEVVGQDIIIRNLGLTIFAVDPILEQSYDLVWSDCSTNTSLPCGLITYSTDEPGSEGNFRSQTTDTYLKIDFQELGDAVGEKLVGTFEARVSDIGGNSGERFDITRGAFNVVIQ